MSRLPRVLLIVCGVALAVLATSCLVRQSVGTRPRQRGPQASAPAANSSRSPEPSPAPSSPANAARTAEPTPVEPTGPAPRIKFLNPACDFGEIWQGENADCVFKLENDGDADLHISEVKPGCGCTVAEITNEVLPPGGTSEIKATFRSGNYRNKISKTITVFSDDPRQPQARLTISGTIKVPVDLQPSFVVVSRGRPDSVETREIKIVPFDPKGFRVLSIEGAPPWVHYTKPKPSPEEPGVWLMTVTVGPDLPLGQQAKTLLVKTNAKRKPVAQLRVYATVTEEAPEDGSPK
jgi:hypothetical protein